MVLPAGTLPKEFVRKNLIQCQNCFKSKMVPGVTLSKCAGCKIALYCSKECQKANWPNHKETCRINQGLYAQAPDKVRAMNALRAFCSKHRPSIAEFGIRALDLPLDTTRGLRDVVVIYLKPVPNAKRPEKAFKATNAEILPFEAFGEQGEQLRQEMKEYDAEQKQTPGMISGIMVMVVETESGLTNVCPVSFGQDVFMLKPGDPWKAQFYGIFDTSLTISPLDWKLPPNFTRAAP